MGKYKRKHTTTAAAPVQQETMGIKKKRTRISKNQRIAIAPELKKYYNRRYDFFWRYDEGIRIDREGWYSVTPEIIATDTAARVAQLSLSHRLNTDLRSSICVIDACCGVGGNAIKFAEWCEHVIAIDVSLKRLEMARHNARVYGVDERIEFIHGDFGQIAHRLKADVVYMSPPWGGPEYMSMEVYDLGQMPVYNAKKWVELARLVTKNIVCFLPRNCDPTELAALYPEAEACDVEMNYTGGFLKAVTVYFNDLAKLGSSNPRRICEAPQV